ncbi:hypothetical protein SAMN05428946_2061 [Edaphobacillus lindanitolerans]|uniref:Uncharacterized protein n=1 Tax=Edaphobacillus lindanitolerans TaxID=550447 RepID=A0A1U7PRH0_9BACI|nr:hypothetical protein SAMN05428946_2061 [Edaphobacillus lindanitolerans]
MQFSLRFKSSSVPNRKGVNKVILRFGDPEEMKRRRDPDEHAILNMIDEGSPVTGNVGAESFRTARERNGFGEDELRNITYQ